MTAQRSVFLTVFIATLASCANTEVAGPSAETKSVPASATPGGIPPVAAPALHYVLTAYPESGTLYSGETSTIQVRVRAADGTLSFAGGQATWKSSNPGVVNITSNAGVVAFVRGGDSGNSTLTATIGSVETTLSISVTPRPSSAGTKLIVESFQMIEFQYPSAPGRWFYAPLLRVRESNNAPGAAITNMTFSIAGLIEASPCATYIRVGASQSVEVFREIYGDYQFEIEGGGSRAREREATLVLTVNDGSGPGTQLTVKGPVVAGELPKTYTGGSVQWFCQ